MGQDCTPVRREQNICRDDGSIKSNTKVHMGSVSLRVGSLKGPVEGGLGLAGLARFTPCELGQEKGRKGIPGWGPGIFKGLEGHKIMGSLGNSKTLFVAGAQGAW